MLRKAMLLAIIVIAASLSAGCLNERENTAEEREPPIDIQVLYESRQDAETEVPLLIRVTQGGEPLDTAEEVMFEVWRHGQSTEAAVLEAEALGDGMYESMYHFEEDNYYYVQPRVKNGDRSTTLVSEIIVGRFTVNRNPDQVPDLPSEMFVSFGLQEGVAAGEPSVVKLQVNWEDEPWEEADVRFEITNTEGHTSSVEAEETAPGEYHGEHTFEALGEYSVIIYMEKDDVSEQLSDVVKIESDEGE
ncbi:hypothetical protein CR205_14610 [Alteribacter lacisalsi]|uniref:YtkA-like domain-containing protein n=1 Tax=Alteribacter lacisalsi TaxID=2045244 RepID=A0A2W0H4Z1_9BACI|nr:FixH family protein [Alteribacter lacisalsi]PYZ96903.1 hypothetical protein CR205_14610 [Alteribacter lacisalsi]